MSNSVKLGTRLQHDDPIQMSANLAAMLSRANSDELVSLAYSILNQHSHYDI